MTALEIAVIEAVIRLAMNPDVRAEIVGLFRKHGISLSFEQQALIDQGTALDREIAEGEAKL